MRSFQPLIIWWQINDCIDRCFWRQMTNVLKEKIGNIHLSHKSFTDHAKVFNLSFYYSPRWKDRDVTLFFSILSKSRHNVNTWIKRNFWQYRFFLRKKGELKKFLKVQYSWTSLLRTYEMWVCCWCSHSSCVKGRRKLLISMESKAAPFAASKMLHLVFVEISLFVWPVMGK